MSVDVTNYKTAKQCGIIAFYRGLKKTIRVYKLTDDFKIQFIDDEKSNRFYSRHSILDLKKDVILAIENFTGEKINKMKIQWIE